MASTALDISNYVKSIHETCRARSVDDLLHGPQQGIKSKFEYFKERRSLTSESTTLGTEHQFEINRTEGVVGDFWLEITPDNSAEFDVGTGGACSCIDRIEIEIGKNLVTYSGETLFKIIHMVNKDEDTKTELVSLMGVDDVNADPMIVPILAPGSNLMYGKEGSPWNPFFPIGACSNPMVIKVYFETGAYISKTNALAVNSIKLRYMKVSAKNLNLSLSNKRPSRSGIFYSWFYVKPIDNSYTRTLTDATEDQFTIDNVITNGQLKGIVIDVLDRTTSAADMEYFDTQPIDALYLQVKGTQSIYEHDNKFEARLRCMKDWKILNKYNSTTADLGYYYPMALEGRTDWDFDNVGTKGQNLNLNKPTVKLTCTTLQNSATAHTVRVCALYKCYYQVREDQSADTIIAVQ